MAQTSCYVHANGRLGKDPNIHYNERGKIEASFSIAYDSYKKQDGAWVTVTNWIKCKAYGKAAERVSGATTKDLILVDGPLSRESYTNREGRTVVSLVVKNADVYVAKAPESASTYCKISGVFRVGNVPDYKVLTDRQEPLQLVNFSVVYNTYSKKADGEWDQEGHWFRCVNFGQQAARITDTTSKGNLVFIQGLLSKDIYVTPEGEERHNFNINVSSLNVLDSKYGTDKQDSDQIAGSADDTEDYPF